MPRSANCWTRLVRAKQEYYEGSSVSKSSGQRFVQLHVHSDYSLLDGAAGIEKMVKLVSEDNQPGLALTDHGTPAGTIQLFTYAEKYGITPIPGVEAYHVPNVEKMRERIPGEPKQRYHMILLAVTTKGYQNLLRLTSEAHTDHFYSRPNMDDEMLARYSEGIVATSGCMGSRVNQMLLQGNYAEARRQAVIHQAIYGSEGYFIELQSHDFEDAIRLMPLQLKLAKDIGAPLLATSDSHYLHKGDAQMHDALLCLGTTALITDTDRYRFSSQDNYIHTTAEMYELFPPKEFPGACTNTLLIEEMARGIDIGLPKKVNDDVVHRYLIPDFKTPKGESAQKHLSDLAHAGVMKRYGEDGQIPEAPQKQLSYELDVIHKMGFDEYFLIVMDIVVWAKSQGIMVGPGRGSAAGSLVAYALGITGVDPIHYKLYFERFLNPGRKSMPDIDIDFEQGRRGEVQAYVARTYPGRVSYIATYGVLKPKSAMNGASRVLGNMVSFGQRLSGMWPGTVNQLEAPISEIVAEKPSDDKFTDHWRMGAGLRKAYNDDRKVRETIDLAISFEGTHNIKGVHPSGMLITPGPLADYVPVHLGKDKDSSIPICSYDSVDTEKIGGLKMDILGLVNLSVIGRTLDLIKMDIGTKINIDNIPLDDKKVYKMLGAGESDGVFQLESPGMRDLLRRVKPESIEDISAVIALFRPGPMGSNAHFLYADAKNGKAKIVNPDPHMNVMFAETYGVLCVAGDTGIIDADTGRTMTIDSIEEQVNAGTFRTIGVDERGNQVARKVSKFYRTGMKPVLRITLANNRVLRVSAEHPVLTLDGWKPAGELMVGMRLATPTTVRPEIDGGSSMTEDQARLLGYLLGDGSITNHVNSITSTDQEVFDEVTRILAESFSDVHPRIYGHATGNVRHLLMSPSDRSVGKHDRSVSSRDRHDALSINLWLSGLGYTGFEKSRTKFIPDEVFSANHDVIRNLLATLWDTDGHVGPEFTFFKTISPYLANGVRRLLDIIGIPSRISESDYYESADHGDTIPYSVYVYDPRFWEEIVPLMVVPHKGHMKRTTQMRLMGKRGFSLRLASKILTPAINESKIAKGHPRRSVYANKAVVNYLVSEVGVLNSHIGLGLNTYPESMIPVHLDGRGSILSALDDSDEIALQLNMDWSQIASIEEGPAEEMYDITVEGIHNFLADGIVVHNCYQEQLIALVQHYAGYNATDADIFRKAVGKKDPLAVAREEAPFKAGLLSNGYSQTVANKMWDMVPPFAAYAFNKAHSVSYGFITYQTAWLKVNYPAQYAAACIDYLSSDRVFIQVESARRSGVRVSPPNINSSHAQATTASNHVWLGIGGIAHCGPAALQNILSARSDGQGDFRDLGDFLVRTSGVNKKAVSSLISAGCFDAMHESRKAMHDNLEVMIARARKVKIVGQAEDVLDGLFGELMVDSGIKGAMDDFDLAGPDYGTSQRIAYEIGALGFPASEHPFHYVSEYLKYADPNSSLIPRLASPVGQEELTEGQPATIYGTASSVAFQEGKGNTKPKSQFFLETDSGGRIKCTSFGYDNAALQDGDLVVAQGSLRTFMVAETEQQEFRVTDSKVTPLDRVVLETKRMEDVGTRVRTPQQSSESSRPRSAPPTEQRTSRRRSEVSIRFIASDQSQIDKLIERLDKLEEGEVKVVIQFADTVGSSDERYDLSEKRAAKIAEKLGLEVSF